MLMLNFHMDINNCFCMLYNEYHPRGISARFYNIKNVQIFLRFILKLGRYFNRYIVFLSACALHCAQCDTSGYNKCDMDKCDMYYGHDPVTHQCNGQCTV